MNALIGLVLGAALGGLGGTWYWGWIDRQQRRSHIQSTEHLRQTLEQEHQNQLQEALQAMKAGHQAQLQEQIATLEAEHDAELQGAVERLNAEQDIWLDNIVSAITQGYEAEINDLEAKIAQLELNQGQAPLKDIAVFEAKPQLLLDVTQLASASLAPDSMTRLQAAQTMINLVTTNPQKAADQPWFQSLARLATDSESVVRQAAMTGLAQVRSDRVIPILERALRDPDVTVVQVAAAALPAYKQYLRQMPEAVLPNNSAWKKPE